MFAPILRLLAIYLAVALAVFAFFNRDRLTQALGWGGDEAPAQVSASSTMPEPAPAPAPAAQPAEPVFAPPPGENGVPAAPVTHPTEPAAQPAPAPAPAPAAQPAPAALQVPTPPAAASTAGVLQTPRPAPQPAPAPTAAPAGRDASLDAARRAFWQGDMNAAIANYRKMLAQYPDDEAAHGELGNIYYMNGNRVEAATQYEAAAMAALKAGRRQQAQMLENVLQMLDRAAAGRVQKAMEDTP